MGNININYFTEDQDQSMVLLFLKRFNPRIQGHCAILLSETVPGLLDILIGDGGDDDLAGYDHNLIMWEFLKIISPEQCISIENLDADDYGAFSEQILKIYNELKESLFPEFKYIKEIEELKELMDEYSDLSIYEIYQKEKMYLEKGFTSLTYGCVCQSKE